MPNVNPNIFPKIKKHTTKFGTCFFCLSFILDIYGIQELGIIISKRNDDTNSWVPEILAIILYVSKSPEQINHVQYRQSYDNIA